MKTEEEENESNEMSDEQFKAMMDQYIANQVAEWNRLDRQRDDLLIKSMHRNDEVIEKLKAVMEENKQLRFQLKIEKLKNGSLADE
jgi:hypothetical protein